MEKLKSLKGGSKEKIISRDIVRLENLIKGHKKLLHAIGNL